MISRIVNSSILPIIIKKIRLYFIKKLRLLKLKSANPYDDELTVFIKVNIDSLKASSNSIWFKLSIIVKIKSEKINIITDKKYLLISLKLKLISVNNNLLIKTFFGLLKDKIWFNEYLKSEYILINLIPELVEKKEPPIITKIK